MAYRGENIMRAGSAGSMTLEALAAAAGCNEKTVRRITRKIFPGKIQNGIKTVFSKEEACEMILKLPKRNVIDKTMFMVGHFSSDLSDADKQLDRLESLLEKMINSIPQIVANTVRSITSAKQVEYEQDYFSVLGYAKKIGIRLNFSQAINYGMQCVKYSKERNIKILWIPDKQFGSIRSYHIDVLRYVFTL